MPVRDVSTDRCRACGLHPVFAGKLFGEVMAGSGGDRLISYHHELALGSTLL